MKTYEGIRHLLIDLDGTLLASGGIPLRLAFIRRSLAWFREKHSIGSWAALRAVHSMRCALERESSPSDPTNEERAADALAAVLRWSETQARMEARAMSIEVFRGLEAHFSPIPGAHEFISWASRRYTLTLATNPVWPLEIVRMRLDWAGIDPSVFQLITHAGTFHSSKPHVSYYSELLDKLGFSPHKALMIGDSKRKDSPATEIGISVHLISSGNLGFLRGLLEGISQTEVLSASS